ncbi:two-component system, chemotaxis family, sensor kinase CheA [Arboricoccus pini]|uniref:Chemotaxis protein CheA n=1 Tax=Arboricoccus pini TaxID=1963835 RepID=A0A212RTT3_9PROT|nr:chemotaxis protein CheW [Arboricoccus pini]SNB76102.1 two-component system, chemotaxis family, sensor kinase CheA [Arboricoccus pini]
MDDLITEFLTECTDGLQALDRDLLSLEQHPDDRDLLGRIFRIAHTIKGTCGFLGLARLEKVAHAAENLLDKFRSGEMRVTPEAVTVILVAIDRIKLIIEGIAETEAEPAGDDSDFFAEIERVMAARPAGEQPLATPEPAREAEKAGQPRGRKAATREPGPAVVAPMSVAETPPVAVAPSAEPAAKPADAPAASGRSIEALEARSLRVPVDLLERLMTVVGELVLTRNELRQITREHDDGVLKTTLQRLSRITSDLQEGVMKTRMQPISSLWGKLPRLIRDLSVELGKPMELVMQGGDTELDRQVLELVRDPLTHMVRNAADHGIDTPAERRAAGKPEAGVVRLDARHDGGCIVIEIRDDGRGLNFAKIREKVVARGLCSEAEAASMPEQRLSRFIFEAGFSTAAAVTSVSGRGVGMDVVRTNIERIGGTIDLTSRLGEGTCFTVRIPLTLAIIAALVVEVDNDRYAIPQLDIVELIRTGEHSEHRIEHAANAKMLRLRERMLPLLSLAEILGVKQPEGPLETALVVVLRSGGRMFGLIVDQVFDTEEIVVKPLSPILRDMRSYAGSTILGDGEVVMILDPGSMARSLETADQQATDKAGESGPDEFVSLLLFEHGDSGPMAVPVALVTRLEQIPSSSVERASGKAAVQYRGGLMPLATIDGNPLSDVEHLSVIVFSDQGYTLGLVVDRILDTVDASVAVELASDQRISLGSAVIEGKATELVDVGSLISTIFGGWFETSRTPFESTEPIIRQALLVDDSAFVRGLLTPILQSLDFKVTAVPNPVEALRLRDGGSMFDIIVSDIEMPEMNGFDFAVACRAGGAWVKVPMVALTSHDTAADVERGRHCGFDGHVGKFRRDSLVEAIAQAQKDRARAA